MATYSIAGNTGASGATGELVYCMPVGDYPVPQPFMTVTDSSKNYSFSGLSNGLYNIYTSKAPLVIQQVLISGGNAVDVNFSS